MKKGINNKGFTLVELLAVLIILTAIMGLAIPSITSFMERTKENQKESKIKMLESFAEEYVEDNKNAIYGQFDSDPFECSIPIKELEDKGYLTEDASVNDDGNPIEGYIIFNSQDNTYEYIDDTGLNPCVE